MNILGRFCLLIVVCSFLESYKRFLLIFMRLFFMDCACFFKSMTQSYEFGCGFFVFRCFSQVFNILGLFFMFCLGLKVLQFIWYGNGLVQYLCGNRMRSSDLKIGFCSKNGLDQVCDLKFSSCECNSLKFIENYMIGKELVKAKIDVEENNIVEEDDDDKGFYNEDQEYDVLALRRLVKIEKQQVKIANLELEKERIAAASATEEAMAMILRLQNEKSSIEIEANQYRKLAQQKQEYDHEVIQSLQWIVIQHEYERSVLEEQLKLCKQKLKMCMKEDEMDQFEVVVENMSLFNTTREDGLDGGQISSLDMDSSDFPINALYHGSIIDVKQLTRSW